MRRRREPQPRRTELTSKEAQALILIRKGERVSNAAYLCGITESAFKVRLQSARAVLGAKTTVQAVADAVQKGLIE